MARLSTVSIMQASLTSNGCTSLTCDSWLYLTDVQHMLYLTDLTGKDVRAMWICRLRQTRQVFQLEQQLQTKEAEVHNLQLHQDVAQQTADACFDQELKSGEAVLELSAAERVQQSHSRKEQLAKERALQVRVSTALSRDPSHHEVVILLQAVI